MIGIDIRRVQLTEWWLLLTAQRLPGEHDTFLFSAGVDALSEDGFETAVLWVHPGNERARSFYEAHGCRRRA